MSKSFWEDGSVNYWQISKAIKNLYLSDSSVNILLDFERVLDELDIYAFENWEIGELIEGPNVGKYLVDCTFMWLGGNMPDPRGAKRLLPFDCNVQYQKSKLSIPVKVKSEDDFKSGTKVPKQEEKDIWLVKITMPKNLIKDVMTGSTELEGQDIDLEELDSSYEQGIDTEDVTR